VGGRGGSIAIVQRTAHEGRDDLRQLGVHLAGQVSALEQIGGRQLGQQVLERPAVAVEAEVRKGGRGQQPPKQVERVSSRGGLPGTLTLAGLHRVGLANPVGQRHHHLRVGGEERLHGGVVGSV